MINGIDISNWQSGLNVNTLPDNVRFVICKATEGTAFIDPCCDSWIHDLKSNERLFGFYHFADGYEPISEAEWFVSNTKDYFGDGLPVLDLEMNSLVSNLDNGQWANTFVERVHELTGVWPIVYTYAYMLNSLTSFEHAKDCPLWLAGYPYPYTEFISEYPPYNCSPWAYATIWQFTSSLNLPNWSSPVDGNLAYINESDWHNYCNLGKEVYEMVSKDDMEQIALEVWSYYNHDVETRGDAYQIIRSTLDKCEELEKRVSKLEGQVK